MIIAINNIVNTDDNRYFKYLKCIDILSTVHILVFTTVLRGWFYTGLNLGPETFK